MSGEEEENRSAQKPAGAKEQILYVCEGFVKKVEVAKDGEVKFTLDPSAPYIFEKKTEDSTAKRYMLLASENSDDVIIRKLTQEFVPPSPSNLNTLLIVKAGHMKVRVASSLLEEQLTVENLTVM